ncbi:hydrolase, partial [Streptomyces ziwulingensis]|uniref:hydrolase n=1 Tax=Streptomyces ziwulingensis TaxID=1045501 RepID=UPI0031EA0347
PTVRGRFRGKPRLAVDNLGNTKVTASVAGSDTGDHLSYDLRPASVQIEPGRAVFVKGTLRPQRVIWFGSKEERPYKLAVQRSGVEPLDVDGTYVQRSFLPRWLATFLGVFLALAIAFVMIWLAYKPQVRSLAAEQLEQAGVSTLPPSPSAEPVPVPEPSAPSAAAAPVIPTPARTPKDGGSGSGGGGGGGEATKEAKAEERTAATAVLEIAARSEGRHICYRAYVADQGWQEPVCDGAEAGTVGKGLPIKALNIAVAGTKGVEGNGAHVVEGWLTGSKWASAKNGVDMYLGSTKEAVSPLQGFTVGVNEGSVCHNANVKDRGWLGMGCTKPAEWMYGGSPMEARLQLEAVRFTV